MTEFWYTWRLVIEAAQFRGLTEDGMQEGCAREWGFVGQNRIQAEPKDKMKLKTGRSPDIADTIVTGVEVARRLGFVIAELGPRGFRSSQDGWKSQLKRREQELWHACALSQ